MIRREYSRRITVNNRLLLRVIIDPHYEVRHSKYMSDSLILDLVMQLHGYQFEPVSSKEGYEYFVTDNLRIRGKAYKLIWLLEKDESYIGVINAFRRK